MDELDKRIRGMVCRRYRRRDIAERLGVPLPELNERIKRMWMASHMKLGGRNGHPDPTPQEIAERAAIERQSWSEAEHRRRAGLPERMAYEIPTGVRIAAPD